MLQRDSFGVKYLDLQLLSTFRNLSFRRIDTYFESCGILRKYVLKKSSQNKKLKRNLPTGQRVSHTSKNRKQRNQVVVKSFLAVAGSCRGKYMVFTRLSTLRSSLLIPIPLVPIATGCLFRVTNKLRVIIDDITLLVPSKECFI